MFLYSNLPNSLQYLNLSLSINMLGGNEENMKLLGEGIKYLPGSI